MQKTVKLIAFILLISIKPVVAQIGYPYEKKWMEIRELLESRDLTKSALLKINELYAAAKKEKNQPQQICALIYKINAQETYAEDKGVESIKQLEEEIKGAEQPMKSVLLHLTAITYEQHYQKVRWKITSRIKTTSNDSASIDEWSENELKQKIREYYLASVYEKDMLAAVLLNKDLPYIQKGNASNLRPTLYDLLAHNTIDYLIKESQISHDEADINTLTSSLFLPAEIFCTYKFTDIHKSSFIAPAVSLYQSLINLHLNNANPDILIDLDLKRLQTFYSLMNQPDKMKMYRNSLQHLLNRFPSSSESSMVAYELANSYAEEAGTYNPKIHLPNDSGNPRWLYLKALQICKQYSNPQKTTRGSSFCLRLQKEIEKVDITFNVEDVNIPNKPFRILVSYRNTPKIWLRIIPTSSAINAKLNAYNWNDREWRYLTSLPFLHAFSENLPATEDYQEHKAELRIPSLPPGNYYLLISNNKDFSFSENKLASQYITISNIAWIQKNEKLFVLHRETGAPLRGAKVQTWNKTYDYRENKYIKKLEQSVITEQDGSVLLKKGSDYSYEMEIKVFYQKDSLDLNASYQYYSWDSDKEKKDTESITKIWLHTDRAIYRPGQPVFFKGIIFSKKGDAADVSTQKKICIYLKDANSQIVDSLVLSTNEFGSFHGRFYLPTGSLNGTFSISNDLTFHQSYISVEEYKRPKFFVSITPPVKPYQVYDSISIKGSVNAFAGFGIAKANVRYRVLRKARIPYIWLCRIWGWPSLDEVEMINGTTIADGKGNFNIQFPALPDKKIRPELTPVFHYEVFAEATDQSGETQFVSYSVEAGYQSILLDIKAPEKNYVVADKFTSLKVETRNLMNIFQPSTVTLSIHQLQTPDRLIRTRLWEEPDQFVINRTDYLKLFPNDEYQNESQKETWNRIRKVTEITENTNEHKPIDLSRIKWQPGWYVIDAEVMEKNGKSIKQSIYIEVRKNEYESSTPVYSWNSPLPKSITNSDSLQIYIGSDAKDVYLIREMQFSNGQSIWKTGLINQSVNEKIQPPSDLSGGFRYGYCFVLDNRFYEYDQTVSLVAKEKQLQIEFKTYRDKTKPGSEEEWKIQIRGSEKNNKDIEVLTSMYDASLDQFKQHEIAEIDEQPYLSFNSWTKSALSSFITSFKNENSLYSYDYIEKTYDKLVQIELQRDIIRYDMMKKSEAVAYAVKDKRESEKPAAEQTVSDTAQKMKEAPVVRTNFGETVFFYPTLRSDSTGNVFVKFKMPDALTKWKWQIVAHTKKMATGYATKEIITQKDLIVEPNAPRFLREGDRLMFSARVTNNTEKELSGSCQLELFQKAGKERVDGLFQNLFPVQYFTVDAGSSETVRFSISIPHQYSEFLTYRITASANAGANLTLTDGVQAAIPVVSNQLLVKEAMNIHIGSGESKKIKWHSLIASKKSETLQHQSLTIQCMTNPVWMAVLALPSLSESQNESIEQSWNRFYAHALANKISIQYPHIKTVIEQWSKQSSNIWLSELEKNTELKQTILRETPWIMDANAETAQRIRLCDLFSDSSYKEEWNILIKKLFAHQTEAGGFSWMPGGREDRYMTQYILTGIGHLIKLNALPTEVQSSFIPYIKEALNYLDLRLLDDYTQMQKSNPELKNFKPGYLIMEQLYMRSFFPQEPYASGTQIAYQTFFQYSVDNWIQYDLYNRGIVIHLLKRNGKENAIPPILNSIREKAIIHPEKGNYFRQSTISSWFNNSLSLQTMLIEVFQENSKEAPFIEGMKRWLMQQKRTQMWSDTRSTAEACYALLMSGTPWMNQQTNLNLRIGNKTINSDKENIQTGTGLFEKKFSGNQIDSRMGNISLQTSSSSTSSAPASVSLYWQYFEKLEKIKSAHTFLSIKKELFIEEIKDKKLTLTEINDSSKIKIGDKIRVRWVIRNDRLLEYVSLRDQNAACMETIEKESGYAWKEGVGYYKSVRETGTDIFFDRLPAGTFLLESSYYATHSGNFSSGIATVQCLYAPDVIAHSTGNKINIK